MTQIVNGTILKDAAGNTVCAHGGGFLHIDGYYYWFGENRREDKLVSCYRSRDLMAWEFRNHVVTKNTHSELNPANAERPKVIFNEHTGKYIMWLHWENGIDYSQAKAAILVSDTADGDYSYVRSFRPLGHMSRDCTLFKDEDGQAYFISAARENADLHIYRLTADYLDIACLEQILWPGQKREAPALIKRGGYYFLITSGCTGWEPNQAKYAFSRCITGPWSDLINIGSPTTFDTQPTYILHVEGTRKDSFVYVGDRWDSTDYHNSTYAFLPLAFPAATAMEMDWASQIKINVDTGEMGTVKNDTGLYRLQVNMAYLGPAGGVCREGTKIGASRLAYTNQNQLWEIEYVNPTQVRLIHHASQLNLEPEYGSQEAGTAIVLAPRVDHPRQVWDLHDAGQGYVKLQNNQSNLALEFQRETGLVQTELNPKKRGRWDQQAFLLANVYE